jgi:hypothetical protein
MDLFEKRFICDTQKCRGLCCYYGDSGAPLTEEERSILEEIWPLVKKYMRPEGIAAVERTGTSMTDSDGDLVTPMVGSAECAYAIIEDDIYMCAIERAWHNGDIQFRKPESCHLFPVRVKRYREFDAVNYEEWKICKAAIEKGGAEDVPVYRFLEEPLKRVFGNEWYREITIAAAEIDKRRKRETNLE